MPFYHDVTLSHVIHNGGPFFILSSRLAAGKYYCGDCTPPQTQELAAKLKSTPVLVGSNPLLLVTDVKLIDRPFLIPDRRVEYDCFTHFERFVRTSTLRTLLCAS